MRESGNYAPGTEFDPRAPWNQSDPDEAVRDITYTCYMHRTAPVSTLNYTPGEWERDEDGYAIKNDDDFSDTDWLEGFVDQYRTPAELISLLKEIATEFAAGRTVQKLPSTWQHIADDCEGWAMEDEYAEEA